MDVFDLSSQEDFSPLKPLAKRPRKCFNQANDTCNQASDTLSNQPSDTLNQPSDTLNQDSDTLTQPSDMLNQASDTLSNQASDTPTQPSDTSKQISDMSNAEASGSCDLTLMSNKLDVKMLERNEDSEHNFVPNGNKKSVSVEKATSENVTDKMIIQCTNDTEVNSGDRCDSKGRDRRKPVYIYDQELIQRCDAMPKIINRASMVHSLIEAYGLLSLMQVIPPRRTSDEEMMGFHAKDYVDFLALLSRQTDEEKFDEESGQYGLTYDCPINRHVYAYAALTSGASLRAAECLLEGRSQVAVNWCGGWHHAKRDMASGFCYVNDIVLSILKLREKYDRVLYVDLDVHHGDGVEDAFCASPKVMTVSVHKHSPGFFPGSGGLNDGGIGKGRGYTINIPLQDGMRDKEFVPLVCRVLRKVREMFGPQAVVCQCGSDGLSGDPMDSFNLTHTSYSCCLQFILQWKLPTLVLGGGGYHSANTARCWTYLTAVICGRKLPLDIPDHKYFMAYGPDYELSISPGNRKNMNSRENLQRIYSSIIEKLNKLMESKTQQAGDVKNSTSWRCQKLNKLEMSKTQQKLNKLMVSKTQQADGVKNSTS